MDLTMRMHRCKFVIHSNCCRAIPVPLDHGHHMASAFTLRWLVSAAIHRAIIATAVMAVTSRISTISPCCNQIRLRRCLINQPQSQALLASLPPWCQLPMVMIAMMTIILLLLITITITITITIAIGIAITMTMTIIALVITITITIIITIIICTSIIAITFALALLIQRPQSPGVLVPGRGGASLASAHTPFLRSRTIKALMHGGAPVP